MTARNSGRRMQVILSVLMAVLLVTLIVNLYLIFENSKILDIRKLSASINVSSRIGFDLNSSSLTFGEVIRGGSSIRSIKIENTYAFPVEIVIYGDSVMENFISPEKFRLDAGEARSANIAAVVPEDADYGKYEGAIFVKFMKD